MKKGNNQNLKSEANKQKAERPKPKAAVLADNTAEVPTASSKLPTEQMEVHHHPQLEHKHKPWKEYLLEGLMIFIAVMMGFVAENIRESIDNSEHAKQLIVQLVNDLKADTTQLGYIDKEETKIVKYNDTLFSLLQQPVAKADTRRIQKMVANSHSMWPFHPSTGATTAIKNELHLKQFSNSEIVSYFSRYERNIELLHTDQDINLQYQRLYLDPFLTQHFTPANMVAAFDSHSMPTGQMRDLSQHDLDQLAADMVLIRIISKDMLRDNREVRNDAVNLLKYVKEHYHLED